MYLRALAAAALPPGSSLKRDRGSALFVTDAPRKGWQGAVPGFRIEISGSIARLYPLPETALACPGEPDVLAKELAAMNEAPASNMELFIECCKCADAPEIQNYIKCDRKLRQSAARAMRTGSGADGLYYCALMLAEADRQLAKLRMEEYI